MEIKTLKISDLKAAEYNPRIMPEEEMAALRRSIKTFGFVEPVVVNMHPGREYILIGGHQRKLAAEMEGLKEIPCALVRLDEEKEKALNLALNKIKGRWDEDKLSEIIFEIRSSKVVMATGFKEDEVSRILDNMLEPMNEESGEDIEIESESKLGEIYELGPHKLICGDCTDPATYQSLMGEERADMIFTDPPYNVAYKSRGDKLNDEGAQSIMNDDLSALDFDALIQNSFREMFQNAKEGASFYICSGWQSYPPFLAAMLQNGFYHSGVIIWVKPSGSLSFADYSHKSEWILKAKKPIHKTAQSIIYGWKKGKHSFFGENEYDVWDMPRKAVNHYIHPTEKPDWLAMRAIRNSTMRNAIILDPFGGSGSTMMAAEKTGRISRLIELDPKFCDAIRKRWAIYEKQKAYMENNSR